MNIPSKHLIEDGAIPSKSEKMNKLALKLAVKMKKMPPEVSELLILCDGKDTIEEISKKVGRSPQEVEIMLLKCVDEAPMEVVTFRYLNLGAAEKRIQMEKRLEQEKLDKEKERQEKERLEKEKLEKERQEKERLEKEKLEKELQEKERLEKEKFSPEKEKERLENLTALFKMSDRVNINDVAGILGLSRNEVIKKLMEWRKHFEIKLDGDYINIKAQDVNSLMGLLDKSYASWSSEPNKAQKKE